MNEIELEKTYYIKSAPVEIDGAQPTRIVDIYIPASADHAHLRLRQKGDHYMITKKQPLADDVSEQVENTIPLTADEFAALAGSSDRKIVKDRYQVQIAGRPAEVDVFLEKHAGLILVDFEFASPAEKAAFRPPRDYVDVTTLECIAGGVLSGKSYAELSTELSNF